LFYYEEKRVPLDFLSILKHKPVIAAFRKVEDFRIEGLSNVDVLFVLGGDIFNLPTLVQQAESVKKLVFVDIDLVKGIGKDASGIRYLARESHVHGVITTKSNLINSAQKEGLISIQRIFVLDSESLTGGLNVVDKSKPDAIEILPGLILPKIMDRIRSRSPIPVIAGGLITTPQEIQEILSSGAIGISTTSAKLLRHTIRRAR
jgi:glycerol uptake operon antiterminator